MRQSVAKDTTKSPPCTHNEEAEQDSGGNGGQRLSFASLWTLPRRRATLLTLAINMTRIAITVVICLSTSALFGETFDDQLQTAIQSGDADAITGLFYAPHEPTPSEALNNKARSLIDAYRGPSLSVRSFPEWMFPVVPQSTENGMFYTSIRPSESCYLSYREDSTTKRGSFIPSAEVNGKQYLLYGSTAKSTGDLKESFNYTIEFSGKNPKNIVMDAALIYTTPTGSVSWDILRPDGFKRTYAASIDSIVFPTHPDGQTITLKITKSGNLLHEGTYSVTNGFIWKK